MKLVGTAACIIDSYTNNILLMKKITKSSHNGKWVMPGGKIEENETIDQCILREVYEETNLDLILVGQTKFVERVKQPDNVKYILFYRIGLLVYQSDELGRQKKREEMVVNTEPSKCEELPDNCVDKEIILDLLRSEDFI
jgi:8-oxo-dGTP pyrophosphatase MutT (NUDIX family)